MLQEGRKELGVFLLNFSECQSDAVRNFQNRCHGMHHMPVGEIWDQRGQ